MRHMIDWYTLKLVIKTFVTVLQYALFPIFLYHFVISIFGWFKRKEVDAEKFAPVNRFALVVAAHNEEKVIGNIVRNLKSLDYPSDMYDIYVIADNCTDRTAKVAETNGAKVYKRSSGEKKGKGYALEWMFEKIFKMNKRYDAICVFDADNLVSPNFLKVMNKHLCMGHKIIQGYLDSKNPTDSIISGSYAITYWLNNRLYQLPRYYLGLSCAIGGTGFVVATDVLKKIGWGATCLTEDLEFTMKLALNDMKVHWAHDAVVYDEKPLTLKQSWRQRKRWMQGQADCACRYFTSLMRKAVKDRSMVAFDCALYLIQPAIIVISGICLLANFIKFVLFYDFSTIIQTSSIASALSMLVTTYISGIFVFAEGKISPKLLCYFALFPLYNLTWIPIIIQGFIYKDNKEWIHTVHTRAMDIQEIKHNLKEIG